MAETYRADIIVSDLKRLVRRLNEIEPELAKTMRREWKEIVEPARAHLSANIKSNGIPMSGFRRRGSTVSKTWNNRGQSSRVYVQMRAGNRVIAQMRNQTILRLVIRNAATIIADMAGRTGSSRTPKGTKTDWYVYPNAKTYTKNQKPGFRRHTVTTQGDQMLQNLQGWGRGSASRVAYPSVEKTLPGVRDKLLANVNDYIALTNRELGP
jgi:hypothetical protein